MVVAFEGCGSVAAGELCKCKERVTGRICDQCVEGFWNLRPSNKLGCSECTCNRTGTVSGVGRCDQKSGQCLCRANVEGRGCDKCVTGSFALRDSNLFGCRSVFSNLFCKCSDSVFVSFQLVSDCDCDVGGAISNSCNKVSGKCPCRPRIDGRRCDRPLDTFYYPTLHQYKFEVEDFNSSSGVTRYAHEEDIFPDYSWRGYAVFNSVQQEVFREVKIAKPALFKTIFRYVNRGSDPVTGTLTLRHEHSVESDQVVQLIFEPTTIPKLLLPINKNGQTPTFVLGSGVWRVTLKFERPIMLDYMVLLPDTFYEPQLLQDVVNRPCRDNQAVGTLCRHYSFPTLSNNRCGLHQNEV